MARSLRSRVLMVAAASALAAAVAYGRVLGLGFAYDDEWTLVRNQWLERPLSLLLRLVATGDAAGQSIPDATRPTMIASLWIDRRLFDLEPLGYHAHSLFCYALSVALVSVWLFVLSKRTVVALVGGVFFAVAPIHAEVVAAVNYREDLIASIGVLVLLIWVFAPRPRSEFVDWVAVVSTLWFVALLAKASAIAALPLVVTLAAAKKASWRWWSVRWRSWSGMAAVTVLWGTWRLWLRLTGRDDVPTTLDSRTWADRVTRTARFELHTLGDALAPVAWSPEHATLGEASWLWVVAFFVVGAVTVALSRWRRTRLVGMGLAIALVAPLPMSPLVGPYNELADRYAFLAVAGGGLAWGGLLLDAARTLGARGRGRRRAKAVSLALALGPLGALAWLSQPAIGAWQSDLTLWRTATERAPGSARAWTGLSRTLRLRGRLDEAEKAVERAIELDPNFLRARVTRIYTLLARGEVAEARREIRSVIELGGGRQLGMRRAIRCATRPPAGASACIDRGLAPLSARSAVGP